MTLEVEIGGRIRTVTVEAIGAVDPTGGRFRVTVVDQASAPLEVRSSDFEVRSSPTEIDVRRTDLGLSLVFADTGRSIDLAVTERPGGEQLVQFPHVALSAVVEGRRARRGPAGEVTGTGEQRLLAPMPGRIVRVLVKPGDEVVARQGLVVVEAMKMENELTAARAGRVKDVGVTEGQSVQAGQLLVIVE
jgi:biotin carboxyl carrier protein